MALGRRLLRRALAAAVLGLVLSGLPRLVRAAPPTLVLCGSVGSVSSRIEAELAALGFQVVRIEAGANASTPEALQAAARQADAALALSLVPSASGVEVLLVDRVTGKALSRDVVLADAGAASDRIIAVRVVELIHASLLELELPEPAKGEVRPTPELRAAVGLVNPPVAPTPQPGANPPLWRPPPLAGSDAFLFDAALGASASIGALRIAPLGALGAYWQPAPHVAVGLGAALPLAAAYVSAPEGSAGITTWQLRAGARIDPLSVRHAISPFFDLGLGLLWFHIAGTRATSPYRVASEQLITAGPDANVGLRWRLSPSWALRSTAGASVAFAKPIVEFAGRHVVTLARPLAVWTLGIEYRATSEARRD